MSLEKAENLGSLSSEKNGFKKMDNKALVMLQ